MSKVFRVIAVFVAVMITLGSLPMSGVIAASSAKTKGISANVQQTDTLTEQYNKILYEFTAPQDGYFTANVSKKNLSDTPEYRVSVKDSNADATYFSAYGSNIKSPEYGIKAGQKCCILVESSYNALNKPFVIKVNFAASAVWENEPNDNQSSSKQISVNTEYYGCVSNDDNGDYFGVRVPSNGYISFSLGHKDITQNGSYILRVYDANGGEATSVYGKTINTMKIGVKAGTTLYVKVGNDYDARNQGYKLKASFTSTDAFEGEPNGTSKEAKAMAFNKVYTGIVGNWASDREDYYKFTVKSISQVSINFGPVDIAKKGTWDVAILNAKGKSKTIITSDSAKTVKVKLAKGTYFIKVSNSYDASGKEYKLKVSAKNLNFKKGKSVIKSATVKKYNGFFSNKIFKVCTLSKTVKAADGYEIRVSTNKSMKNPVIKEKVKGKKKLQLDKTFKTNGKTVYVQVVPYVEDPFGNAIYGNKSKVKKVNVR